jgi:hypothetical protein
MGDNARRDESGGLRLRRLAFGTVFSMKLLASTFLCEDDARRAPAPGNALGRNIVVVVAPLLRVGD